MSLIAKNAFFKYFFTHIYKEYTPHFNCLTVLNMESEHKIGTNKTRVTLFSLYLLRMF